MKKLHKYVIAPTIISTTMMSTTLVLTYLQTSTKIFKSSTRTSPENQSNKNTSLLETVLDSLSRPVHAFAEQDGYNNYDCYNMSFQNDFSDVPDLCADTVVEPMNICMKEGETRQLNVYLKTGHDTDSTSSYRPVYANISQTSTGLTASFTPETQTYLHETTHQRTFSPEITVPVINEAESGSVITTDIVGGFDVESYNEVFYDFYLFATVQANIRVDNINTAPTLTLSPSTGTEITLDSASETRDYTASATVNDDEGNITNLTFNLRQNGTIVQTQVFTNVAPGATIEHTFTGLTQGSYTWDVSAVETDARGTCAGYANADPPVNLQASAQGPDITLIYTQDGIILNGFIYNDLNDNDTHDEAEHGLPDITVTVTDSQGVEHVVVTDSEGRFSLPVPSGTTTIQVDQNDPDLPAGVNLANNGSWTVEIPESESEYTVAYAVGRELLPATSSNIMIPLSISGIAFAAVATVAVTHRNSSGKRIKK